MKAITVEKTIHEITGYEADDGTWFRTEEECRKYEMTAHHAAAKAALALLVNKSSAEYAFSGFCGCFEDDICVYDIKDANALQVVNTYLESLSAKNDMLTSDYVGHKVCVQHYYDDTYAHICGTRIDMELRFSKLMDDLFGVTEGDGNAES